LACEFDLPSCAFKYEEISPLGNYVDAKRFNYNSNNLSSFVISVFHCTVDRLQKCVAAGEITL